MVTEKDLGKLFPPLRIRLLKWLQFWETSRVGEPRPFFLFQCLRRARVSRKLPTRYTWFWEIGHNVLKMVLCFYELRGRTRFGLPEPCNDAEKSLGEPSVKP